MQKQELLKKKKNCVKTHQKNINSITKEFKNLHCQQVWFSTDSYSQIS